MKLLDFTIKIAEKAGALILKESKKQFKINKKGKNDLVTNVDKAAEALIIKTIKHEYPDHGILAEESMSKATKNELTNAEYIWIIDPLDGTTNFAHGLPEYTVSIAIFQKKSAKSSKNFDYLEGEIIAGVVYAPALNELFYAEKGKSAYSKKSHSKAEKIHISKIKKLSESLMATGFPPDHRELSLLYFNEMTERCQAIRRLGSASLDLCYTAAGIFDGFWEFGLKPWDIAAGILIVNEAGGKITDTNGKLLDLFGNDIFASNGKIHGECVKIFNTLL